MQIGDCYVGLKVIGTDEANGDYTVTIKDVVGIITDIYVPEYENDDAEIRVKAAGTQTKEEIMQIIQNNVGSTPYEATPEEINEFFDTGFWVSPDYFEPYQEKFGVSLSEYIM